MSPASNAVSFSQLSKAHGPINFPLTNDYLFRAVLQTNNHVLKGLISALLHLNIDEIHSVEIQNPIILGENIDLKNYILDILVCLNNHTHINLEMQVVNEKNWPDRSLCYLCREFDQLNHGQDYTETKPVIQIGILDFCLFPDHPEFYAHYSLLNEKSYYKYNDKFRIHVLDLTHINLATEEDKNAQLDYWASLFKAQTWEELKNMAKLNSYMDDAVSTIFSLSQDANIRRQCAAREEYFAKERYFAKVSAQYEQAIFEKEQLTSENKQLASEKEQLASEKEQWASEKEQLTSELQAALAELSALKQSSNR